MNTKKRVIFCTYSSIYSSIILERLIADDGIELLAIVNSTRVLHPSMNSLQGALIQLKTSGLRYSTYLFLITDLFRWIQPLLVLRKRKLKDVSALAKFNNIPLVNTKDINTAKVISFIREKNPEILLCAHFNQLLKDPVFAIQDTQFINIHPALLPSYKGVDPVFFAMRDNVEEIGVTLHKMDKKFDSGEIISQDSLKVDGKKSLFCNNCQLFEKGIQLAINWIRSEHKQMVTSNSSKYTEAKTPSTNEYIDDKNYDSWPSSEDVKDFRKSGKTLISCKNLWNQP